MLLVFSSTIFSESGNGTQLIEYWKRNIQNPFAESYFPVGFGQLSRLMVKAKCTFESAVLINAVANVPIILERVSVWNILLQGNSDVDIKISSTVSGV